TRRRDDDRLRARGRRRDLGDRRRERAGLHRERDVGQRSALGFDPDRQRRLARERRRDDAEGLARDDRRGRDEDAEVRVLALGAAPRLRWTGRGNDGRLRLYGWGASLLRLGV